MNLSQSYELAISIATDGDYLDGFTSRQVETIHDMLKVINLELFWKKEDELKQQQQEIESLKAEFTATLLRIEKSVNEMAQGSFFMSVKPQLAQYQSDDCVVVPKEPTDEMLDAGLDSFIDRHELDVVYKAMIEAQEQKNANS